jgi:hypothetical protein
MIPSIARNSTPTTTAIEPIKAVANVIQNQLNLPDGRVFIDYERFKIPPEGLFCVVSYLKPSETVSSADYFDNSLDQEVQELTMFHHIQIDLMSLIPDNSARLRKEEVLMALHSFYGGNYFAKNGFGVSWIQSDVLDTSVLEGKNYLNRYTTSCTLTSLHSKSQSSSYFDNFSATLSVNGKPPAQLNLNNDPLGE